MGEIKFTEEQQQVIDTRETNILVSAAAGSGKTAVLTERIISLITDSEHPIDIDRMLIVTFTKAAAAEMRERITKAINERLDKAPEDTNLLRQQTLIHNAQITTIDSFCLFVIKNNFGDIDLEPGFRTIDEGEGELLLCDVLDEILEKHYQDETDEDFRWFVESYAGNGREEDMEKLILNLHRQCLSSPYPEKWLDDALRMYESKSFDELLNQPFWKELEAQIDAYLKEGIEAAINGIRICQREEGLEGYIACINDYKECLEAISNADTYEKRYRIAHNTEPVALGRAKKGTDEESKNLAKHCRDKAKAVLDLMKGSYYSYTAEEVMAQLSVQKHIAKEIVTLVKEVKKGFDAVKREKNLIDFTDMEHFALKILTSVDANGQVVPTKTAMEYQDYFEVVMVDEYQDSNYVQEYILESVSRGDNYFMVGDVKQSIYKFRQARPEIFVNKYDCYTNSGNGIVINLNKNFRSRTNVIEFTNIIFERIMTRFTCSIDYDDKAKLYLGAEYPEDATDENKAEVLLLEKPDKDLVEDLIGEDMTFGAEALMVANKINELMASDYQVYDMKAKVKRELKYSDIVILLRKGKGQAEVFKTVLESRGVPVYTNTTTGYFDAMEIRGIINLITVIDNPLNDIPMYGVMTSYFGNFTKEEVGCIRSEHKDKFLFEAMELVAVDEQNINYAKCKALLELISEFREKMPYVRIRDLISELITKTGYINYVTALPRGEQRRANVNLLLEKAESYEQSNYHGVFRFIRYIERLQSREVDFGEAGTINENDNVVRIMTIHKSKGLEFPVCFVACNGGQINKRDAKSTILFEPASGIGIEYINPDKRIKYPGFVKEAMARKIIAEAIAEEMRVLYVALTRAKEKLFVTGTIKDAEGLEGKLPSANESIVDRITTANTYLDFILPALASAGQYSNYVSVIKGDELAGTEILEALERRAKRDDILCNEADADKELENRFSYEYPYDNLQKLYIKTTVSELKKKAYEEHEEGKVMFPEKEDDVPIPTFATNEKAKVKGTKRGDAYHKLMELISFEAIESFDDEYLLQFVKETEARECEQGRFNSEYLELVDVNKCVMFLKSSLAKRMVEAAKKGKLWKEKAFFIGLPADKLENSFPKEETIIVQGVIDVYFEEDGKFVVADYKTDRVDDAMQLIKRYKTQLAIYSDALRQITGKEVGDNIIYSFGLGKDILL